MLYAKRRIDMAPAGIVLATFFLAILTLLPTPVHANQPSVLTSISISPTTMLVVTGGTQQFTVSVLDQYGNSMTPTNVTWSASGGGTVDNTGLFTANTTTGGPFNVTAMSTGLSASATVNIVSTRAVTFGTPVTIPVTGQDGAIVADIDGDGHQDILVRTPTSLVFLFGNGDLTFSQVTYPYAISQIDSGNVGMAVGNLFGNGRMDIVVTNGDNIAVIENLGNRTFAAPVVYAAAPGSDAIALGDFNGDSHLDIAVVGDGPIGGQGPNDLAVLLNNGAGVFSSPTLYAIPGNYYGYAMGVAALATTTGGPLDLVCSEEDELATPVSTVFDNAGNGTFSISSDSPISVAGGWLFTTDLNNDGSPDIVASDHWNGVPRWGLGNGAGSFTSMTTTGDGYTGPITAADFTGDGFQDLALAFTSYQQVENLGIYSNNGDGTFAPFVGYSLTATDPLVGDFNEDGQPDLAMYSQPDEIVIYPNTTDPAPTITTLSPNTAPANSPVELTVSGHGLLSNSAINWNGAPVTTSFNYQTGALTANIASSLLPTVGTAMVTVTTSAPGGGLSNSLPFTITSITPTPTISPIGGPIVFPQTVTIADTLSGASIFYTTNGDTPTPSSTSYSGPITVSSNETIKAIATSSGLPNSEVATAVFTQQIVPTPAISPNGGTFAGPQTATLSDTQTGSVIYYTTDNSTPTTNSAVYSVPITVSSSETINAIAAAPDYANSAVATAAFTIQTIVPTISPNGGVFASPQTAALSDTQTGSVIYYTTDNSTPTTSSSVYTAPISIASNETVNAIAVAPGCASSTLTTASFTIQTPVPTITPDGGDYTGPQSVSLSDTQSGASIYYTTNGSTPTTNSAVYSTPITVSSSETINAIAAAPGFADSADVSASFTIQTVAPTISPDGDAFTGPGIVTLSDTQSGAVIYFTADGSTPTTTSPVYSSAISVASDETIHAIAAAPGCTNSTVATASFTVQVPSPTISPNGGTFTSIQTVTISDTVSGATIYYTTDGSAPSSTSPVYSGPITVSSSETVNAIAVDAGLLNSSMASASFTVNLPPVASFSAGLQMISLPYTYSGVSLDTLFGYTGVRLAVWQPLSNSYAVTTTAPANEIALGQGYWVRFPQAVTVTQAGTPAPTNATFVIQLQAGWNMVGDPFTTAVPLSDVLFNNSSETFAQATSTTDQLIGSDVFAFTAGSTNYTSATTLSPGAGYWIYAFAATDMDVPAPSTVPPPPPTS